MKSGQTRAAGARGQSTALALRLHCFLLKNAESEPLAQEGAEENLGKRCPTRSPAPGEHSLSLSGRGDWDPYPQHCLRAQQNAGKPRDFLAMLVNESEVDFLPQGYISESGSGNGCHG